MISSVHPELVNRPNDHYSLDPTTFRLRKFACKADEGGSFRKFYAAILRLLCSDAHAPQRRQCSIAPFVFETSQITAPDGLHPSLLGADGLGGCCVRSNLRYMPANDHTGLRRCNFAPNRYYDSKSAAPEGICTSLIGAVGLSLGSFRLREFSMSLWLPPAFDPSTQHRQPCTIQTTSIFRKDAYTPVEGGTFYSFMARWATIIFRRSVE